MIAGLLIATTVICTVFGQVLIKMGVSELDASSIEGLQDSARFAVTALFSWKVFLGFLLSFVGALAWILVLTKVELGFAYPFMALSIILVLVASSVVFGEVIPYTRWTGVCLVGLGLVIVAQG